MEDLKNTETVNPETESEEKETSGRFYTEEEIAMLEQKAGDKRISQYQKTLERKQRESEKLRSMNEEDKKAYELSQRELAIEEKEKALAILENKQEGLSILMDKGLDVGLIDYVLDEEAESMYAKINKLDKLFKKSVKAEVEKRLGSSIPKKNLEDPASISTKDFKKMSLGELQRLATEQPELYKSLSHN